MTKGTKKAMTIQERIEFQECLNKGMSFNAIGKWIVKIATTVSREVKGLLQEHTNSFVKRSEVCPLLLKAPFVCNGCEKRSSGQYKRQLYVAENAQKDYETLRTELRSGIFKADFILKHQSGLSTPIVENFSFSISELIF